LSGLNDKDAAIAAGYSVSVAENTKQRIRIWKPYVRSSSGCGAACRMGNRNEEVREAKDRRGARLSP